MKYNWVFSHNEPTSECRCYLASSHVFQRVSQTPRIHDLNTENFQGRLRATSKASSRARSSKVPRSLPYHNAHRRIQTALVSHIFVFDVGGLCGSCCFPAAQVETQSVKSTNARYLEQPPCFPADSSNGDLADLLSYPGSAMTPVQVLADIFNPSYRNQVEPILQNFRAKSLMLRLVSQSDRCRIEGV